MSIRTESARSEVRPEELEQYRRELGRITGHHNFVDPELFAPFGLPGHLDP